MRYLYTTADDQLFAHAPGRRDFFKEGDDRVWAHESHGWLIAAKSGETLAHRTGDVYYGAVDGERLYRVSTEPAPTPTTDTSLTTDTGLTTDTPKAASRSHRAARSVRP
jgi:hypothetical protein